MDLQYVFLCDDAEEDPTGKLDVRGIFHDLLAPGFPAVQERMVLVLVIEWGRKDQGRYALKAELVAPGGTVVLTVDGHSEVEARPAVRPPARTRLLMPIERVVFPKPGKYHLRVIVKGERFRGPSLHLMEMEGAAAADGPTG
ncbi:MAG: DUF6941 family protein [Longimicrobiales bacterium]